MYKEIGKFVAIQRNKTKNQKMPLKYALNIQGKVYNPLPYIHTLKVLKETIYKEKNGDP